MPVAPNQQKLSILSFYDWQRQAGNVLLSSSTVALGPLTTELLTTWDVKHTKRQCKHLSPFILDFQSPSSWWRLASNKSCTPAFQFAPAPLSKNILICCCYCFAMSDTFMTRQTINRACCAGSLIVRSSALTHNAGDGRGAIHSASHRTHRNEQKKKKKVVLMQSFLGSGMVFYRFCHVRCSRQTIRATLYTVHTRPKIIERLCCGLAKGQQNWTPS